MPIKPERLKEAARRLREEANAAPGSVEEYIKKKLEAARAAALEKSRTREMGVVPRIVSVTKNARQAEAERAAAAGYEATAQDIADRINAGEVGKRADPYYYQYYAQLAENARRKADELDKDPNGVYCVDEYDGSGCVYTATDNYGEKYRVASNNDLYSNPLPRGFMQIPFSEAAPGDVIQDATGDFAGHAMVLDSITPDGSGSLVHRYNWSRGPAHPDQYVKNGRYYMFQDNEENRNAFRFVGTPADSLRWKQEFESGQFGCGGKKYPGGGKFFRTNLQDESPMMYTPMKPWMPDVSVPMRFIPEPYLGDYVPPSSTGMAESYPISVGIDVPDRGYGVLLPAEEASVSSLDPLKDAARRIMAVENSKNYPGGGWDAKTGRWYPHKSIEGGADTIAYGIKLSNGTPEAALALRQGYLTDEQAVSAVDTLVQRYYDAAKRVYDGKYGDGEWDKLSDKSQSILVDYSYNPGLAKFPNLMEGFHSGNLDLIRKNYKRYSNGKELGRNRVLLEELDTLDNEYPIFRGGGGKINIKPENRGKFNALLKRTGKSASWFKEHGTPLQRKRATFALNARKWRHDDGGEIEREPDDFTVRDNTYVNSLVPLDFGFNAAEERPVPPSLGQARWDDGIMGVFPFVGDALQGAQAFRDFGQGDVVTGLQTAGLLLVPNVVEKTARGLFKKSTALSALDDVASGPPQTLLERMRKIREKAEAERVLAGYIPDPTRTVLSPGELGVERAVPQEVKDLLYHSSMERMRRQRPDMDAKELGQEFGDVANRTYREYPRSTFDKAGRDRSVKGSHYGNGHIAIPDDAGDVVKSIGHELRHDIDYKVPLTKNEKNVLGEAYGEDFDNTGRGNKSPDQLKKEEVTTNFDARSKLLGDKIHLSTDEQNALIDAAAPEQVGLAVYKANGYGSAFMKKLVDENKWTTARANKIKEAMKTVGAISGVAAVGRALYNDENLPVQLAEGGRLFYDGGDKYGLDAGLLYSPPKEEAAITPTPYTEEGYQEKLFYDDPANRKMYTIVPGDTMWGISQRENVPVTGLLRMNPSIGDGSKIMPGQQIMLGYNKPLPKRTVSTGDEDDSVVYKVQKGDYLGKIAKDNGMSMKDLLSLNPQFVGRENSIAIGESVNLGKPKQKREFKTLHEKREWEGSLDNVGAIQNYKHTKNYAIVDKSKQTMTVYSPSNKIIRTIHINTGQSNQDYNTKTYQDDKGHILYGQGNMSTPAGITEIVSVGKDYGHNSYVRARVGSDGKVRMVKDSNGNMIPDTISSSMHYEKGLYGPNSSNGCIRMSGQDADSLKEVLGVGSRVYTLPQVVDENGSQSSRFRLEDGKLSFYSDDPVGRTSNDGLEPEPVYEKGRIKRDKDGNFVYRDFAAEDDYNQTIDMTASPLKSAYDSSEYPEYPEYTPRFSENVDENQKLVYGDRKNAYDYARNRAIFSESIADNKAQWMKDFIDNGIGINSDTYNMFAELAMALANQESKFGTSVMFGLKSENPELVQKMKGGSSPLSIGVTQMKFDDYSKDAKDILKKLGINTSKSTENQHDLTNAARATMALLAFMYTKQLTPSKRRKLAEAGMFEEEALALMFNGKTVGDLMEIVKDPDWRDATHFVGKGPHGILGKIGLKKEVPVVDYANKAMKYMAENDSFKYAAGGIINKYSKDSIRQAIAKIRSIGKI